MSGQEPITAPAVADSPVDTLLTSLRSPDVLEMLEITEAQLLSALGDADLLATLQITHQVLMALKEARVLGIFLQLPIEDRANFIRWIGGIDDAGMRVVRTQSFVTALRLSPLAEDREYGTLPLERGEDSR